ncbi:hypothetical protein M2480_000240 [Parabacteroides sp. PFB2-12]|uniref:hypothetical protein n=1 Tax=Parabacteroides sp. PFB2-12 TaxID=2940652 RepID=UPI002473F663|nr:hypothetical protein [Parabacteroides sp. PFB2-12]MDH6389282.1 hypothetical protein [Parabacteroides sp. PFB2-12]
MQKLPIYSLLALFLLMVALPACEEFDENYSTNPNLKLRFSVDTLAFDTIFTETGSTTRQFMIYNRNKEALNIEHIRLAGAERSGFRINVDGRKGSEFNDIDISSGDSLYVFVEVTIRPQDQDQPFVMQDSVLFSYNGNNEFVLLHAYGQDVYLYKNGGEITTDTTFTATRPFLIYGDLVVAPGATLRIEEGATFYMHDKANIIVHGSLLAEGSEELPITIRGDRTDYIIPSLPYDHSPAQWGGIRFMPESYGNKLDYVYIRNGNSGLDCLPATPDERKISITNSRISNMGGNLLKAVNCDIEVINTELSNARDTLVAIRGGKADFIHCTLANYMSVAGRRDTTFTLYLSNNLSKEQTAPLTVRFDNSLIDGNRNAGKSHTEMGGEIFFDRNENETFAYHFNHCLIKTAIEEDPNYTNVLTIPASTGSSYTLFFKTGSKKNEYSYDFRIAKNDVVAVRNADPEVAARYPIDRYGVSRTEGAFAPTIGAYEFIHLEEEETE